MEIVYLPPRKRVNHSARISGALTCHVNVLFRQLQTIRDLFIYFFTFASYYVLPLKGTKRFSFSFPERKPCFLL